jgi:cardiolipin synthase
MQNIYYPIYILYILIIVSLFFFDRKKPVQRISWVLVLVFIPILGLVLYLILGSDNLLEYRRKKTLKRRGAILNELDKIVKRYNISDLNNSSDIHRFLYDYCSAIYTDNNNVEVFTDGSSKYNRLFEDLRGAKGHIHVQYFIIHNDEIGRELISILAEKAQAGVEVRLLYDRVGCLFNFIFPLLRKLRRAGGKVLAIRP